MRLEHLPGLERHARRLDRLDDLAEEDLDAELLELLLGVLAEVLLEHPEELRRSLDERDPRVLLRHVRVVLGEGVVVELGQRAGALDPGWAAADDDDVECAVLGERVVLVRRLPLLQYVLLEADGVGERVHRERVLGSAGGAEEVDLGAEREHEVVIGQRLHLRELDLAACEVDPGHRVDVDAGVLLIVEEVAQGVPHLRRLQQAGCDLVEERLERVVVVLVDDHDVHVRLLQRARRTHAREATAENQDARSRRLLVICHFRHLRSPNLGRRLRPSIIQGDDSRSASAVAISGRTSTEIIPAPISDVPTSRPIAPRSMPIPTIATISGRPVALKTARLSVSRGAEVPQPEQRRRPAHDDEEPEEERRQSEALGRQQAVEVEVHPRDDEVDRDEEPVADPSRRIRTGAASGELSARPTTRPPANAPSTKSKPASTERKTRAASVNTESRTAAWPVVCTVCWSTRRRAAGARGARRGGEQHDHAEDEEKHRLGERAVGAGEEDRDDEDRPELARDAGAQDRRAERRRKQIGVGEDRDEGAERRRAQRDAEQPALRVDARPVQREADGDADRDRDRPAGRPAHERPAGDAVLDQLDPGEEEQEDESEVGEKVDVGVDLGPPEPLRADQDPEQDLEHDSREDDPAVQPRENRAGAGGGEDEHERAGVQLVRRRGQRDQLGHAWSVGVIPHVLVNEWPGSSRISASPLRNAFGGQVIGSTAMLRRSTSGSGSPVNSIT